MPILSTINPLIPETRSALLSAPVRNNFQAAYNDITALWAALEANSLPDQTGHAGEFLTTNGTLASWAAIVAGTVTSVNASTSLSGLSFSGGPITTSGTLSLTGTLGISSGGTGATTANDALNALLPSQGGHTGEFLTTNGTNASWTTNAGGDVVGPGSATDNAIARFDGTTGKLIQNSVVTIADTTGAIAGARSRSLSGSSSGTLTLAVPAAAGSNTLTFPAATTDFSATGGASQVVKQTSAGGAFTVAQLAASDLSNGTTGSGAVVLATSPTLVTPTLGAATATSINGLTITSSTGTLTIPNSASLIMAGAFAATLTFTNTTNVTFPTSGTLATTAGASIPSLAQGDLLYASATNTLSALNKNTTATRYLANTGTSNNPAWAQVDLTNGVTGILPAANGGTGVLNSNTITLGGNINTAGAFSTSGANSLTLTTTGSTNVTLPTSGTLATTTTPAATITVANEAADTTCFPVFVTAATGDLGPKSNASLTFNSSTGALGASSFSGAGTGLTGTAASLSIGGTAAIATTVTVANEGTDTTCFPLFATAATGDLGPKSNANLTFNSNTGLLSAPSFTATGTITGGTHVPTSSSPPTVGSYLPAANTYGIATNSALKWSIDTNGVPFVSSTTRVTSNFSKTSDTVLAAITGLSATLQAGKTYWFECHLYTTSNTAGGVKIDWAGGTVTATSVVIDALGGDTSGNAAFRATALNTVLSNVTGVTTAMIQSWGTITVNGAGTLIPRFAQSASNGTASIVLAGSYMKVGEIT